MLNPALIWVNILEVVLIVAFLAIIRYFEEKMRCWSPSGWGKFFVGGILPLYVAIFFITLAGFGFKISDAYLFVNAVFLIAPVVTAGLSALAAYAEYWDYCQYYRNFKPCACTCKYG